MELVGAVCENVPRYREDCQYHTTYTSEDYACERTRTVRREKEYFNSANIELKFFSALEKIEELLMNFSMGTGFNVEVTTEGASRDNLLITYVERLQSSRDTDGSYHTKGTRFYYFYDRKKYDAFSDAKIEVVESSKDQLVLKLPSFPYPNLFGAHMIVQRRNIWGIRGEVFKGGLERQSVSFSHQGDYTLMTIDASKMNLKRYRRHFFTLEFRAYSDVKFHFRVDQNRRNRSVKFSTRI